MSMAIINLHLPVELLTILLSAVARLRSLRSDGHCMFASDASGNGVAEMCHRSVKRCDEISGDEIYGRYFGICACAVLYKGVKLGT